MQRTIQSAFQGEVFRPLAVIILPGALAVIPWVFAFHDWFPELSQYRSDRQPVYYGALLLVCIAIGLIIEDLGSQVEARVFDKLLARDTKVGGDLTGDWDRYLQMRFKRDEVPIGQGYLRTILLRSKFSLSFGIAIAVSHAAFVALSTVNRWDINALASQFLFVSSLLASFYLAWESYEGFRVLARVRRLLVKRYWTQTVAEARDAERPSGNVVRKSYRTVPLRKRDRRNGNGAANPEA